MMKKRGNFVIDMRSVFECCRSSRQPCYYETVLQWSFQIVLTTLVWLMLNFVVQGCIAVSV